MKSASASRASGSAQGDRRTEGETDKEVCDSIVKQFRENGSGQGGKGAGGVSYTEVAKKAWEVGRSSLAAMLLDHEPRAANQVPLLLQMRQDRVALIKAVDSGDTDLGEMTPLLGGESF
jgi:hypothetical protein